MNLKKLLFREVSGGGSGVLAAASSWMALTMIAAVVLLGAVTPAHAGLIINATFDSSLNAAEQGAINSAISTVEADVSSPNNISVAIYFTTGGGLGESITGIYVPSYYQYYNALAAVATSPTQLTALASLGPAPTGPSSGNPVNGSTSISITSAEGRNLGFDTPGVVTVGAGTYDTEILLNTSITSPPNGLSGNYALDAVAAHEIDESLGIGGTGSTIDSGLPGVGDLDLYRYTCGVAVVGNTCSDPIRSYSDLQTTDPYSYFSIDGGTTVLSYFNQTAGADYGDWLSNPIPAGFSPQVQDAFGEPSTDPQLGPNELTALCSIGYSCGSSSAVPEPSSLLLFGSMLAMTAAVAKRRLGLRKDRQS